MTTIGNEFAQSFRPAYVQTGTPSHPGTIQQNGASAAAPKASSSQSIPVDDFTAAIAASRYSGGYSFTTVAQNARIVLSAGIQTLGHVPDSHTTANQWDQIFNGMDRRSIYAVATNQGGQFGQIEQDTAGFYLQKQLADANSDTSGSPQNYLNGFQRQMDILDNASPEEKQSVQWAANMAAAKTSYNLVATDAGQAPQSYDGADPLVQVLMQAMLSAQYNPSKDKWNGQSRTLDDILNQPWAKGWESQIQAAYSATAPQGGLVDVKA